MRRWYTPVVVVLMALTLAGCSIGSSDESGGLSGSDGEVAPQPGVVGEDASGGGDKGVADDADQQVIYTGYLTITAEDPIEAADDAVRIVERAGGRIDSRTEQPPVDGRESRASLVVRIPSEVLTPTLDDIKELGEVEEASTSSSDVTATTRDLDARIKALQASVDRLLALLATATSTEDLITIETTLSQRQADLESLQSQRRALGDQVDLATISIDFGSEETAPVDEPDNFFTGLIAGWQALVAFFGAALIIIGVVLPWLVLAAVIAGLVLLIVRARRIGRRTPPDPAEPPTISTPVESTRIEE